MPTTPRRVTLAIFAPLLFASLASLPACQSAPTPPDATPHVQPDLDPARDLQRERRQRMGK